METVKRMCVVALLLALAALTAAGCGNSAGSGSGSDPIRINFPSMWVGEDSTADAMAELVQKFNELHKGKIEVVVEEIPDYDAYRDKIRTNVAANAAPDFFIINEGEGKLARYVETGKLMDWTPYLDKDSEWKNGFLPGSLDVNTFDGQVMMLPTTMHIAPIYYNKQLLAQAGFAEFPDNWDDYLAMCEALLAQGVIPISMAFNQGPDNWFINQLVSNYAVSVKGKDIIREAAAGKLPYNDPAFIETGHFIQKLAPYFPPDVNSADYNRAVAYFTNGQAAMLGNGQWLISDVKNNGVDNLYDNTGFTGGPESGAWLYTVGAQFAAALQTDKAKEAAIAEFGKFLTTPDSAKTIYLGSGTPFVVKFDLQEGEGDPLAAQLIGQFQQAPFAATTILWSSKPEVQKVFSDNISSLVAGKLTSEQFWNMVEAENQKTQ